MSGNYWHESRAFLAVAKAGSLRGAAEELQVAHTTLRRWIRHLEDQIGDKLLTPTTLGISLTPKGLVLAQALMRIDQQFHAVMSEIKAARSGTSGVVRLGATDGLGLAFVVPALVTFAQRYPDIQVQLKSPTNLRDLRENQNDITIGFSFTEAPGFTSRPLGWLHFLPMASRDYVSRSGMPTVGNLEEHSFVDTDIYAAQGGPWEAWHSLVSRGRVSLAADTSVTYAMLVKMGMGVGYLANYVMMDSHFVPPDLGARISLRLHALVVDERLRSPAVRAVFDRVGDLFGPANPWFAQEMVLHVDEPSYGAGYAKIFNVD